MAREEVSVARKRLGELLLERHLIDVPQLNAALAHQRQWGIRLGAALVTKGFIAEGTLTRVLSEFLGIPMVDLAKVPPDDKAIKLVSERVCEQYDVFPIAVKEAKGRPILLLAMADPLNMTAIDEIAFTTGCIVKPAIAQISSLDQALQKHYQGKSVEISPLQFETAARAAPAGPPVLNLTEEVSGPVVVGAALEPKHAPPPTGAPPPAAGDAYAGLPTGTFSMPPISAEAPDPQAPGSSPPSPAAPKTADLEALEALEKKFWALMRILARRGLVTKEEFLNELAWTEDPR